MNYPTETEHEADGTKSEMGNYYMLAHHIVVQHKLNEQCVKRLVSSTHFTKLLLSVPSTPRLSFYVLLCTYSSSSILTMSSLVHFCPY